jgi:hypothetical protein
MECGIYQTLLICKFSLQLGGGTRREKKVKFKHVTLRTIHIAAAAAHGVATCTELEQGWVAKIGGAQLIAEHSRTVRHFASLDSLVRILYSRGVERINLVRQIPISKVTAATTRGAGKYRRFRSPKIEAEINAQFTHQADDAPAKQTITRHP